MSLLGVALRQEIEAFLAEDDLSRNALYCTRLPTEVVVCELKIKSPMRLAGLPFFVEVFRYLADDKNLLGELLTHEGTDHSEPTSFKFELPFHIALTGERLALNLLQRASMVATHTKRFVDKTQNYDLKILDTRKTTPGLRSLEKYAVRVGGGVQSPLWPSRYVDGERQSQKNPGRRYGSGQFL